MELWNKRDGDGFQTWAHKGVPLNSQWLVLKNGGADFHDCWFVNSMK